MIENREKNREKREKDRKLFLTNRFVAKAIKRWNNRFDYSKTFYKTEREKVCVICPKHGEFWQRPNEHIRVRNKHGCPNCAREIAAASRLKSQEQFIEDCRRVHGNKYDYSIMGSELLRNGFDNNLISKDHICTMVSSTEFCRIEGPRGYKWPKLEELYFKLFEGNFNAHNALDDIRACAKCFWAI